jgi:uncharacterized sulfatase
MIICPPGGQPAVSKSLVESVDLFPTIASLCGLVLPPQLEGKSLEPILKDPGAQVNAAAFSQLQRKNQAGRSVRTDRYRYTEWTGEGAGVELYDEQNDPEEITNLASDPKHADTTKELKSLLAESVKK